MTCKNPLSRSIDFNNPDEAKMAYDLCNKRIAELEAENRDLALLIKRLCGGADIKDKAMDYLKRKNLLGSALRDSDHIPGATKKVCECGLSMSDYHKARIDGHCPCCGKETKESEVDK